MINKILINLFSLAGAWYIFKNYIIQYKGIISNINNIEIPVLVFSVLSILITGLLLLKFTNNSKDSNIFIKVLNIIKHVFFFIIVLFTINVSYVDPQTFQSIENNILYFILFALSIIWLLITVISHKKNKHYNFSTDKKRKKYIKNNPKESLSKEIIKKLFIFIIIILSISISSLIFSLFYSQYFENGVYKIVFLFSFLIILSNILSNIYQKKYDN